MIDQPSADDPPDRISYPPTDLSVSFSSQPSGSEREVRSATRRVDPFMTLAASTLEIEVIRVQLIRLGAVVERSPQDEPIRHAVYRVNGIRAEPGMIIGVGSHISSQWWHGRIRSVHSANRHFIRYICEREDHPYTIVDVPIQVAEIPWMWLIYRATCHFASCMLGCHDGA